MIDRSLQNNAIVDREEAERDQEEFSSVMGDLQLQSPVLTPPEAPTLPNTGQNRAQQVAALFPNDPTSQEIARRNDAQKIG